MSHSIEAPKSIPSTMIPNFEHAPRMVLFVLAAFAAGSSVAVAQILPDDERHIRWHQEESVSIYHRGTGPAPVTVATEGIEQSERLMTLDEAIRLTLQHSEVIRVLTGVSAVSSGQTIYDTAIATTTIDQAKAVFDPVFSANSTFRHNEFPGLNGLGTAIIRGETGGNDTGVLLSDKNTFGGTIRLGFDNAWDNRAVAGFLNRNAPAATLSYTQPLLAGFGRDANIAPIVIARLQQEQSYFLFKDSMQELVRGTISAYWSLVQARTELWAREKQEAQLRGAYDRLKAQYGAKLRNSGDVAQAKVSYDIIRANVIGARANVLQREDALRNMIGLPPEDGQRIVPSTPPTRDRVQFLWEEVNQTAQSRRPDLIELNLILMADQQRLIRNRNLAQPQLDAVALQQWNGLSGRVLNGNRLTSGLDENNSWTIGVNFSVPLSLRQSRAQVRNQELLIAKDRANIQQNLHRIEHLLATSLRSIDQNFLQYEAFRVARVAADENLDVREKRYAYQLKEEIFLNYLQAVSDWGNVVASEALTLTTYNTELANLELQTGTILETHGIRFVEEQFGSIGTHGRCFEDECYPRDLRPQGNLPRYKDSGEAAENAFYLNDYPRLPKMGQQLPQFFQDLNPPKPDPEE